MADIDRVRIAWYAGEINLHYDALGFITHKTWQPNPRLSMTPDEQWMHNLAADRINGTDTFGAHTRPSPDIQGSLGSPHARRHSQASI